jgi:ubiquinone biosynthesis protein COQ9
VTQNETEASEAGFDRQAVREAIVAAALPHVPFDGWTEEVLRIAARDLGHEPVMALRVFPRGPVEAIECWIAMADRDMILALEQEDTSGLRTRERIALVIRRRFESLYAHREAVRRAAGILALPQNAPTAATSLWRTVDAIWYAVGDTATDFNFYTKRGLLAGVYGAALLYWLEDRSEGSAETWSFVDRRLTDIMRVPETLSRLRRRLPDLPGFFRSFRARPRF